MPTTKSARGTAPAAQSQHSDTNRQVFITMDLQDFKSDMLYFDEPLSPTVDNLLRRAAESYGTGNAERLLLEAFQLARENLSVLVGLYRFYYYQHRYSMAIEVAHHVMSVVAPRIDFPQH